MALIVKCCSSREEEQPTWTLPTSELLQLSLTERMQANLPNASFPPALLLEVCQHQSEEVKAKSPFFLARGQWGNFVFPSALLKVFNQGEEGGPSQTTLSHYALKTCLG